MNATLTSALRKITFGTLFVIAVAFAAQAQPSTTPGSEHNDPAIVKYQGIQGDMMTFHVVYGNPQGAAFNVIIEDQDHNELYRNTYKDKNFDKQFKLPRGDEDKVTFIIRTAKDGDLAKTFEININSRLVADVAVKKLN
jgi:hypothetical protein